MKILFVCTANICRSALAEVMLNKMVGERGLSDIIVESAGVRNYEGCSRDDVMADLAFEAGYVMGGYARYASPEVLESADLIICMQNYHVIELQKRLPYDRWNRIRRFNEICFGEPTDLIDPTGDTSHIYQYVFEQIQKGCETLVSKLDTMALPQENSPIVRIPERS